MTLRTQDDAIQLLELMHQRGSGFTPRDAFAEIWGPDRPGDSEWRLDILHALHSYCGGAGELLQERRWKAGGWSGPRPTYAECILATIGALKRGTIRVVPIDRSGA